MPPVIDVAAMNTVNANPVALPGAALLLLIAVACATGKPEPGTKPAGAAGTVSFTHEVKPVLEAKCLACHSGASAPWGFRLESKGFAFAKGLSGARIVPGAPEQSLILQVATVHHDYAAMPLNGAPLTPAEMGMLRRWISEGADWPDGRGGMLKPAPGTERPEFAKMREEWKRWFQEQSRPR